MLVTYNRENAVAYARAFAKKRNLVYKDYHDYGGDCTNFISQCLVAGNMSFDHQGEDLSEQWYWYSDSYRTPSFTSAAQLRYYLLAPYPAHGIQARVVSFSELAIGDIIFKTMNHKLTHTMIVTKLLYEPSGHLYDVLIAQHSEDLLDFPLSQKQGEMMYVHIAGCYLADSE